MSQPNPIQPSHPVRILRNAVQLPFLGNKQYAIEIRREPDGEQLKFFVDPSDPTVLLEQNAAKPTLYRVYRLDTDFDEKITFTPGIGYTCEHGDGVQRLVTAISTPFNQILWSDNNF
jgi:hypothetical protein